MTLSELHAKTTELLTYQPDLADKKVMFFLGTHDSRYHFDMYADLFEIRSAEISKRGEGKDFAPLSFKFKEDCGETIIVLDRKK